ncbi:MAG: FAD-binding protein [Chitinophagales bacterium]|nr:FAD-binding protein [Chitinophagales bacterium]
MDDNQNLILRKLNKFRAYFDGDIFTDDKMRILYSTDASLYRKLPLAVVYPKTNQDLKNIVLFCNNNKTSIIPRTAGTSLGGQCVGEGIVVDVSRYMNKILEINPEEKYAIVQPGVVRDELNIALKPYHLHFGPNTSTSNRAMIGGMVGNNSSGSFSIKYGTTRENVISIKGYLSDASEVEFKDLSTHEFRSKCHGTSLESSIYRQIAFELNHPVTQAEIDKEYPKVGVSRRNTGYALDFLLNTEPFHRGYEPFNFSKMLCGSEGTLMLFSEIKLKLVDAPTVKIALICSHFDSLEASLQAAVEAMKLHPNQCELMDKAILDCTKDNLVQAKNRFFIQGDPAAILMIEVEEKTDKTLEEQITAMKEQLNSLAICHSVLYGNDIKKALQLRAAGLGVLQNMKGEERPVEFVEDTAVHIEDLPDYIRDFNQMIHDLGTTSVFYAHAGAGELHTRPKVNLKTEEGRKKFRAIAESSAHLVKKYNGSLSGEHGDGLVRAEFIPIALGQRNYELLRRIKKTWDVHNIFNPGKIVDAPPMDTNLREDYNTRADAIQTMFSFEKEGSLIKAAEKCSGSGDCRKTSIIGGTLCPSYQATGEEEHSTRARANMLREFLTHQDSIQGLNHQEIYDVLKLCLSCKACISECPSSVDMAALKSEFLYQYHKSNPLTKIEKSTASFYKISKLVSPFAFFTNIAQSLPVISHTIKYFSGIDQRRSLPRYANSSFEKWYGKLPLKSQDSKDKVYLYVDEFTNYLDAEIGKKTYLLLTAMGLKVEVLPFLDSSRSLISKGFLEEAKKNVNEFISQVKYITDDEYPLIGIEPSAILGIRDDYHRLISNELKSTLELVAKKTFLMEEFLSDYFLKHPELKSKFTEAKKEIVYHGHCHQKSLSSTQYALDILNFPENYTASEIPSGCCGMAGSFGYEHFELSMKIGEMVLFPSVRKNKEKEICASGTSCRHQIKDGTRRKSSHPVEILYHALIEI